jgi:hypothetical protein
METFEIHLESINTTIKHNGAIEEENLQGINLSDLTDCDLNKLYQQAVGYAETLIMFEIDSRDTYDSLF